MTMSTADLAALLANAGEDELRRIIEAGQRGQPDGSTRGANRAPAEGRAGDPAAGPQNVAANEAAREAPAGGEAGDAANGAGNDAANDAADDGAPAAGGGGENPNPSANPSGGGGTTEYPATLVERLADPAADPVREHYVDVLAPFARVAAAQTAEALADLVEIEVGERPAVLVCTNEDPPVLRVLWGLTRHSDPASARTPEHREVHGFVRDSVDRALPLSARIQRGWFATRSRPVPTQAAYTEAVTAQGDAAMHVVAAVTRWSTAPERVAKAVVLPACLVPAVLGKDYSPVQAWEPLRARAAECGIAEACPMLWAYLRHVAVAGTCAERIERPAATDGAANFVRQRTQALRALLPLPPSRRPRSTPTASPWSETTTLRDAVQDTTRPPEMTPERRWPHLCGRLVRLTGAPGVFALPPFWEQYAQQPQAQRCAFLQAACDDVAQQLQLRSPRIAPAHTDCLDRLSFAGANRDSFTSGLAIWSVPALTPADTDSLTQTLRAWEAVLTGGAATPLADLKTMLKAVKVAAPSSWMHGLVQVEHWTVLVATITTPTHNAVEWLQHLCAEMRDNALEHDRVMQGDNPRLPLHVLRRIQLEFDAFFRSVKGRGTVYYPDLKALLQELRVGALQAPPLPAALLQVINYSPEGGTRGGGIRGGGGSGGGGGSPPGTGSPAARGASPGGGGGGGTPGGRSPGTGQFAVHNPQTHQDLLLPPGCQLRACVRRCWSAQQALPTANDGQTFCLAFHLCGRCNSNCFNRATHREEHQGRLLGPEKRRLLTWRQTWVEASSPAAAPGQQRGSPGRGPATPVRGPAPAPAAFSPVAQVANPYMMGPPGPPPGAWAPSYPSAFAPQWGGAAPPMWSPPRPPSPGRGPSRPASPGRADSQDGRGSPSPSRS